METRIQPEAAYLKSRRRPLKNLLERVLAVGPWRLVRAVARLAGQTPAALPPDRVLVIRHNQLGDAVVCSSFIQALREAFPQARIDVLASSYNRMVFDWIPGVDRVIVRPEDAAGQVALCWQLRHQYDLVFQTLFDEHYLRRVIGARLIAGRGRLVGRARNTPLERLLDHAVVLPSGPYPGKLLSLLTPLVGTDLPALVRRNNHHRLHLPETARQRALAQLQDLGLRPNRFVLLNLSAREGIRSLGDDQAAAIARGLLASGHPVLLSAAPVEHERLLRVQAAVPGALVGRFPTLADAMAVLGEAALYLGPDTGSVHFAAAAGVPCVVLFAHMVRSEVWSPYGVPYISVQANPGQIVPDIDPAQVVEAAQALLAGERCQRIERARLPQWHVPLETAAPPRLQAAAA